MPTSVRVNSWRLATFKTSVFDLVLPYIKSCLLQQSIVIVVTMLVVVMLSLSNQERSYCVYIHSIERIECVILSELYDEINVCFVCSWPYIKRGWLRPYKTTSTPRFYALFHSQELVFVLSIYYVLSLSDLLELT